MNEALKRAFTLIELLVVIAIIGILSGLIVVSMGGMTQKATIAKAQVFSNSLRSSLMLNLVSEWKLDDISGVTAADSWSKINNGILTDFTDTTAEYGNSHTSGWMSSSNCISGTCLKFDGSSGYVNLGNPANLYPSPNMVFSFWVKPLYLTKSEEIFGKFNSSGGSVASWTYGLWIYSTGIIAFGIGDGSNYNFTSSVSQLAVNNWYYVTINYNGTSNIIKYYINGQYLSGKDLVISVVPRVTTNPYTIGGDSGGNRFSGIIDEIRIYNAAITTSQIKKQYYVGMNSLLAKGQITKGDYQERLGELRTAER